MDKLSSNWKPLPYEGSKVYEMYSCSVVKIYILRGNKSHYGSGFVWDGNLGLLVTCYHVIHDASMIRVTFGDKILFGAQVVHSDCDVAVLRVVDARDRLWPIIAGDSDMVHVGLGVCVIGSPFGYQNTLSPGIISQINQQIRIPGIGPIDGALQTNAVLNPGSSGSPLFNVYSAKVIGMIASIKGSQCGSYTGIGFAIPVNIVKKVVDVARNCPIGCPPNESGTCYIEIPDLVNGECAKVSGRGDMAVSSTEDTGPIVTIEIPQNRPFHVELEHCYNHSGHNHKDGYISPEASDEESSSRSSAIRRQAKRMIRWLRSGTSSTIRREGWIMIWWLWRMTRWLRCGTSSTRRQRRYLMIWWLWRMTRWLRCGTSSTRRQRRYLADSLNCSGLIELDSAASLNCSGLIELNSVCSDFSRRLKVCSLAEHQSATNNSFVRAEEFTLAELQSATNNFSLEHEVGVGSFGVVYRGILADGREVVIKRGETSGTKMGLESAFKAELAFSSRLHHKHLMTPVGFCREKEERLLVYEYMKNGTLDDHLHDKNNVEKGSSLLNSWKIRIKIALDASRGIEHLHDDIVPPIIHGDIKSANILLDANWTARVSDFGLSMEGPCPDTDIGPVAGTLGYIDPDYCMHNVLTVKSDVYGLGMVLLELLTGKRPIFTDGENGGSLLMLEDYAVPAIMAGELAEVLDPRVGLPELNEADAVKMVADTAVLCVNFEGEDRPTMADVVAGLERAFATCDNGSISGSPISALD